MSAKINLVGALSAHAKAIMRPRGAKACMIVIVEADGQVSMGTVNEDCPPIEMQDALVEAIVFNYQLAEQHGRPIRGAG